MSARQPFLPSRPASRALNRGDDTSATSGGNPRPAPPSDTNDSAELGKNTRALNISGFKKPTTRTSSFGATAAAADSHTAKGPAGRIYAPHPSTPPILPAEFKTPSLPFSRPAAEGAHTSPSPDVANLFRNPKSSFRPSGESGPHAQARRHGPGPGPPSSEQSFFGNAKFFDTSSSTGGDLDDSGYFSEHADPEADRFGAMKRNGSTNVDTRFIHSAKRMRPASPGNDEDIVMQQSRDLDTLKRSRVHRSPSRSGAPPSRTSSILENEGAPSFALPPHVPHPTAAMGGLPGLEFSEADLARYAELYEQGSERWSKVPMEEWVAGADEVLAKFGEMVDMIKDHMSSKMNLYKSLHTRLSNEHSTLEKRAKELRDASQTLVRDSGAIGNALD